MNVGRRPTDWHVLDDPVGINGSGRETSVVEVVIRDGNIHTAYPV
ncbi:hypothetical protein [Streptomyces sp. NPDC096324]